MGAMLGYFVIYSGSLWLSIIGHFSFNFVNVLIAFCAFNGWMGDMKLDEKMDLPFYLVLLSVIITGFFFYQFYLKAKLLLPPLEDGLPNSKPLATDLSA